MVRRQTNKPKAISLFSGAGGDTLGLEHAGFDVVAFSENNKHAIQSHNNRFPSSKLLHFNGNTDITKLPDSVFEEYQGHVDLIFAGFPCQGFSHAGKKKMDDSRNELVYEFVRATRIIQPKVIIGENVSGLLSRKGIDPNTNTVRPVIDIINDLFWNIGYSLSWSIHDAYEYGVPQKRKRLIIIGRRGETPVVIPSSLVNNDDIQHISLRELLQSTLEGAVEINSKALIEKSPSFVWIRTKEDVACGTPHKNLLRLIHAKEVIRKANEKGYKIKTTTDDDCLLSIGKRISAYHGEIVNPDSFSKTIICNYGVCPRLFVGLHNPLSNKHFVRTFQLCELAQIQGFPSDYPFAGSTKSIISQIGNAVPPPLVKHISRYLLTNILS